MPPLPSNCFYLVVISGLDKGKIFPLAETFNVLLGRSKHTICRLADLSVSRVHCEIELRGKRILITDLESGSGTFVNGKRVTEAELHKGDVLRIGDTQLRVEGDIASAETLAPSVQIPPRPVLGSADRLHELTGTKLSHYEVGDVIAKGHSGLVFKAYDFKNDRTVAFKVLWPEFSSNEEEMQRFVRAMKTMLPLRHANLVTLYGAGKTGQYCWIAMEYVEGESVTQVIARLGTAGMLDWKKALRIAVGVARALDYAHGQSIIHRNITPQNVLVGKTPDVTKLGDLMLAKAQEGSLAQQITRPGELLGDVRYMSPERTGATTTPVDGRSDIYSLGALIYALLSGRPPFEGTSLVETITKIRQAEPVQPKKFQLSIPDLFEGVVVKMLAKRPEDRFQSAADLLKNLERVAKYQGVTV
jgi:serine/threonine protein kinase